MVLRRRWEETEEIEIEVEEDRARTKGEDRMDRGRQEKQ